MKSMTYFKKKKKRQKEGHKSELQKFTSKVIEFWKVLEIFKFISAIR